MPINRYIHQIWYQGQLPEKYHDNVRSIIEKNPGWRHVMWNEKSLRDAVSKLGPEYVAKWDALPYMHNRIDVGRFVVLLLYGGASVDVDVVALKGFDSTPHINDSNFIVSKNSSNGFENKVKNGQSVSLNNATILVSQNNPIMRGLIDHVLELSCEVGESRESCVQNTTGPKEFTNYLNQYKKQITVLPNVYFEPCGGSDPYCEVNPELSVLDHQHEGSWVSDGSKNFARFWYWLKENWLWIAGIIGFIVLVSFSREKATT